MNSTSPASRELRIEARSPACWMAGPEVTRIGTASSLATIMANVVLPRPGGPASRMWSGGTSRFAGGVQEQLQLGLQPRLPDEAVKDVGTQLLVADGLVADRCGGDHA